MPYLWLSIIVLAIILEAATAQMVSIWFVAGAIAALVSSLLGVPEWLQGVIFVVITLITVIVTRPLVKRVVGSEKIKTNADRYVGKTAQVIMSIDNQEGTGQVKVEGSIWSARTTDGAIIEAGETVVVERIDGVKLLVRRK